VAFENELKAWMQRASQNARALTIKTGDGGSHPLYPPYFIGDDFVAGAQTEGGDNQIAYPYFSVVSITPLGAKPKGF
jgi:hypothetical protein